VFPGGWPAFAPGRETIAVIDDDPRLVDGIRGGRCDQLRAIGLVP